MSFEKKNEVEGTRKAEIVLRRKMKLKEAGRRNEF